MKTEEELIAELQAECQEQRELIPISRRQLGRFLMRKQEERLVSDSNYQRRDLELVVTVSAREATIIAREATIHRLEVIIQAVADNVDKPTLPPRVVDLVKSIDTVVSAAETEIVFKEGDSYTPLRDYFHLKPSVTEHPTYSDKHTQEGRPVFEVDTGQEAFGRYAEYHRQRSGDL